jgi:peptide/nickel transport system substrate-binding protein
MGLQSHFQWFTPIRRKLNINPILPNPGLFLLMQNLYFYVAKDIYFQKHILFGNDSTRTVNASDFEYSLNRLLDEKSLLPAVGFYKT